MAYTMEKTNAVASQTILRLKSAVSLAEKAKTDSSCRMEFIATFKRAQIIYDDFQNINKQTLIDVSGDAWGDLCKHIVEIDELFAKIEGSYLSVNKQADPSLAVSVESLASNSSQSRSNVKLPPINLRNFDGSLKNWPTFYDLFNTLIHQNDTLSNIEKFQYLISTLSKEPLTLVKHLPLTSDNYLIAYRSLVDRYQNDRVLATFYWQSVCNSPKVTSQSSQSLRDLLNTFSENITALDQFTDLDLWDFTLFNWLLQKVDDGTRQRFELHHAQTEFPKFEDLRQFLVDQCRALETNLLNSSNSLGSSVSNDRHNKTNNFKVKGGSATIRKPQTLLASTAKPECSHCKSKAHSITHCPSFLNLTPHERYLFVKSARLCHSCLSSSHHVRACSSAVKCQNCTSRHNTLLHFDNPLPASAATSTTDPMPSTSGNEVSVPPVSMSSILNATSQVPNIVLLSTVLLEIKDRWGNYQVVRALCDSGSQASFLTERWRKRLGLRTTRSATPISCLGHTTVNSARGLANCQIRPIESPTLTFDVVALVLPTICSKLPGTPLTPVESFPNLKLADPNWYVPGAIDMLLGADIFASIVRDGFIAGDGIRPAAMNTVFGWALLGAISGNAVVSTHSFLVSGELNLDDTLKAFWKVEEVPAKRVAAPDDEQAESLFVSTHSRDPAGRFGVSLPFKNTQAPIIFEGSRQIADRRLLALERRLSKQPEVRDRYTEFMKEYLHLGHMTKISVLPSDGYYIPHHCVFKDDGPSSKIRVVFDASAKDHNGMSLNDSLLVGPKLQSDIAAILLRFRAWRFVFTCDVRQMYRQILISEPHRRYQLIRWRSSPHSPIETYRLNTVTYGIASSPYLAIRCLLQLADEGQVQFPLASQAIRSDLYVDDFASGADDFDTALALRNQLISLLGLGCFELRKWAANHSSLLSQLPPEHCQAHITTFDAETDSIVKILGLQWQSSIDSFSFSVKPVESPCTKRSILSEVAKIYDPLGFLSPLTLFAKRLIQHLWELGVDWDARPPEDVCEQWEQYKSLLPSLSTLNIPRCLKPLSIVNCQLHAFCDASELGYACVVYFRFIDDSGHVKISFVMAKAKVAPLQRLSIPRLELCAAVLLSKVVSFVVKNCQERITVDQILAWSDSTVALSWIRSSPSRWKTFVANRVAQIHECTPPSCWRHIRSGDNPADPASRGLLPNDLLSCTLWWAGPPWLQQPQESWPVEHSNSSCNDVESEARKIVLIAQTSSSSEIDSLLSRFSSLRKIQRIVAYCFRFIQNLRRKSTNGSSFTDVELHKSLLCIVKSVQTVSFHQEIEKIRNSIPCCKQVQRLSPFIDSEGVLRVGGRLTHADMPFETKHPALLPGKHRLTTLLIDQVHCQNLHAGVNTTLYLIQQNFWILSARRAIRRCLSSCYRCFKTRPTPVTPPMGDLPAIRVNQVKAFSCVGVDFGGPFIITTTKRRGAKTLKAYLCLFVCFATKAVHLEIASDLSSDAFLAALRRFIARRGRCSKIFSDCGTNFVGAHKQLNIYLKQAVEGEAIEWHFNPPSAPHFGGLWESGIKSVKTHMARVIGSQILSYEELNTVVVQIEALLNSRPLCSLSTDPNDLTALTPGHFLTLEPLTAAPDPDLSHLKLSRLSRWQLVQRFQQDFWSRWRNEYLHNFYQRGKWAKIRHFEPVDVGTLVLIKDDLAPPLQWRLGRIVKLHPGSDNIARVATVRTTNGTLKRPLVKLCPVPVQ